MTATLAELEARVAALEAEHADYRAVLSAINALGENQRDHSEHTTANTDRLGSVDTRLITVESRIDDTNARLRSIEESQAEIKDILVRARDQR